MAEVKRMKLEAAATKDEEEELARADQALAAAVECQERIDKVSQWQWQLSINPRVCH
jgi:hypothetical protein